MKHAINFLGSLWLLLRSRHWSRGPPPVHPGLVFEAVKVEEPCWSRINDWWQSFNLFYKESRYLHNVCILALSWVWISLTRNKENGWEQARSVTSGAVLGGVLHFINLYLPFLSPTCFPSETKNCTFPGKGPKTPLLQSRKEALEGTLGFLTPLLLCGSCHGPLPCVTLACTTLVLLGRGQATQKCQELNRHTLQGPPLSACPSWQSHPPCMVNNFPNTWQLH